MVFPHAEQEISAAIDDTIGVAYVSNRSQSFRPGARALEVQALVGKI
jgi:hypothetical protein